MSCWIRPADALTPNVTQPTRSIRLNGRSTGNSTGPASDRAIGRRTWLRTDDSNARPCRLFCRAKDLHADAPRCLRAHGRWWPAVGTSENADAVFSPTSVMKPANKSPIIGSGTFRWTCTCVVAAFSDRQRSNSTAPELMSLPATARLRVGGCKHYRDYYRERFRRSSVQRTGTARLMRLRRRASDTRGKP